MPLDRRTALKYAAAGFSLLLPACRPESPPSVAPPPPLHPRRALRLDFRHAVAGTDERFLLTALRCEPGWAGPGSGQASPPDWGDYRFELSRQGEVLYRTGVDSSAVRGASAALSVRAPFPDSVVAASIARRRPNAVFQPLWSATIDPADDSIDRSPPKIDTRVETLVEHGPASAKVDLTICGDGYREAEYAKFIGDARRAAEYLFSVEPFRARANDFNVRAVFTQSRESGVNDPYLGVVRSARFRSRYGTGAAERTLWADDERALREAASAAPYDFLLVLANARRYGGSSYFGGPAVVSVDNAAARYLVLHELAHAIAGLADEYYLPARDGPAYAGNIEPWHPNVTLSPRSGKWGEFDRGTWNKAEYDRYFAAYFRRYCALRDSHAPEERVERFMQEESRRQAALLAKNPRRTGYFEGANGYARGVFRAEVDCIMFSLQTERFCTACTAAINRALDFHTT